jgi:hypothetical protein
MKQLYCLRGAGAAALALLLAQTLPVLAQSQGPDADGGIVVQARGPLHEAFAQPTDKDPTPSLVVPKRPPEPIPEEPPAQRPDGKNVEWIPGYWAWDNDRNDFMWVSGTWRAPPPDHKWVPGHWTQAANGWQWVPGFWIADGQRDIQYLPEPPNSVENGPSSPAPQTNAFYVPGVWAYSNAQYTWRPGYWSNIQAGWVWNAPTYVWTPLGYVFVDGYWDRELVNRGLLFAPVQFRRPLWLTAGWVYRPGFAITVGSNGFFASLFVRPGYAHYYFGDYYDPSYLRIGFRPWYAYGPRFHDPLFSYYGWYYRRDRGWAEGLHATYVARRDSVQLRPARTFVSTTTVTRTSTSLVQPLRQYSGARLTTVTPAQMASHRETVQQIRTYSVQRTQHEHAAAAPVQTRTREALYAGSGGARESRGGTTTGTRVVQSTTIQTRSLPAPSYPRVEKGSGHTGGGKDGGKR